MSSRDVIGSGGNLSSYINPEIDALIDEARAIPGCDPAERTAIYNEIQEIAHEDVAYVWLFVPNMFHVSNQRIGGFEPGATWVYYGYLNHPHKWFIDE